jgi:3-mercaptopyruvate sulfurtransferase SseA
MSKKKHRGPSTRRTKKKQEPSLVIPIVVGVVVVAIVIGALAFAESGRSNSAAQPGQNTAQALNTQSIPYPDVPRVTLQEAQDKVSSGQAVLVDVRSKSSYDKSHVAGAISVPEAEMAARKDELPRDKELILYCT